MENAIIHGIGSESTEGLITIASRLEGDTLVITVRDNGAGMTPQELEELQQGTILNKKTHFSGIGVNNIRDRLQLYYGSACSIHFDSVQGEFTEVTLQIPVEKETDNV